MISHLKVVPITFSQTFGLNLQATLHYNVVCMLEISFLAMLYVKSTSRHDNIVSKHYVLDGYNITIDAMA